MDSGCGKKVLNSDPDSRTFYMLCNAGNLSLEMSGFGFKAIGFRLGLRKIMVYLDL